MTLPLTLPSSISPYKWPFGLFVRNTHQSWCVPPQSREASRRRLLLPVRNVLSLSPRAILALYSRGTELQPAFWRLVTFIREVIKGITRARPWIFLGLLYLDLAQFIKHITEMLQWLLQKCLTVCEREREGEREKTQFFWYALFFYHSSLHLWLADFLVASLITPKTNLRPES